MLTIQAVCGVLVAVLAIALFALRRSQAPTPEQRADDREQKFRDTLAELGALEARGDLAGADALRRRMLDDVAPERERERVPDRIAGGYDNHGTE